VKCKKVEKFNENGQKCQGGIKKYRRCFQKVNHKERYLNPKINLRKTNIRDQIEYTHPKWASSKHPGFLVAVVS
jgi:hypothetical protein